MIIFHNGRVEAPLVAMAPDLQARNIIGRSPGLCGDAHHIARRNGTVSQCDATRERSERSGFKLCPLSAGKTVGIHTYLEMKALQDGSEKQQGRVRERHRGPDGAMPVFEQQASQTGPLGEPLRM